MSSMVSLSSREEVLAFLEEHNTPLLQCEFVMVITQSNVAQTVVHRTTINVPVVGASFSVPYQSSEVEIIQSKDTIELPKQVLLTQFDCPDSGVQWSTGKDTFGYSRASLKYATLNISFLTNRVQDSAGNSYISPIHQIYQYQFTDDGLLKPYKNDFYDVTVYAKSADETYLLYTCKNCKFSYPLPDINLSNPKLSVFKSTINYSSFKYGV